VRRGLVWLALGAVLVAAGAGAWLWASSSSTDAAPADTGPVATATVERGTISATLSWDGTLDRGTPITVASGREGVITRLPEQGATLGRGDELFRVDERPVTLLYGAVPMFRGLGPGDSGADVDQLEANLAALGYDGFTVDDEYTESTAAAVRAWQGEIGVAATGTVARGEVVFVPEPGQVETVRAAVGEVRPPGAPVLDLTGTELVVSLQAEIEDRDRLNVDTEVTVVLPGGDEVPGTVSETAIAQVAPAGGEMGEGTTDPESVLEVEVALAEEVDSGLAGAPVEAIVAIDERTGVLLVPVSALLALAEGGYGLEVVGDDGTTSIVAVTAGLFAGGKVQVEGDGIAEGTVVGVAGR
jgi:hypothetical protein